jgi:hypothetical protein
VSAESQAAQLMLLWCQMQRRSDLMSVSQLELKERSEHSSFVMEADFEFNLLESRRIVWVLWAEEG